MVRKLCRGSMGKSGERRKKKRKKETTYENINVPANVLIRMSFQYLLDRRAWVEFSRRYRHLSISANPSIQLRKSLGFQ